MKLQQKIARGMVCILVVIVIIIILTQKSYSDTEGFIVHDLPSNFHIAREYENFAEYWSKNGEALKDYVKFGIDNRVSPNEMFKQIDIFLDSLGSFSIELDSTNGEYKIYEDIRKKCEVYSVYVTKINELVAKRNILQNRFIEKREKAAENARTEIFSLLDQFKSMMQSWHSAMSDPDFKDTLRDASGLLEQVSRIERDLLVVDSEMGMYLSVNNLPDNNISQSDKENRKNKSISSATVIERRLRALQSLLKQAIKQSKLPVHKRVLSQIDAKIRNFYEAFIKLRNILEIPEIDIIETEDSLNELLRQATELRQNVVNIAHERAQFYWGKIFYISDKLKESTKNNNTIMLTFLSIIAIAGMYLIYVFPRTVSKPLENLSKNVSEFRLGIMSEPTVKSDIFEIKELSNAFSKMVGRLNLQGEINRKYLESIHSLTHVYRDLHSSDRFEHPFERINNAITMILKKLIEQCPKIDLVKAMVIYDDSESGKSYFVRLGKPEYSNNFYSSDEAKTYFLSTNYNPDKPELSKVEYLPLDKGLTGFYYSHFKEISLDNDTESDFFDDSYVLQNIGQQIKDYNLEKYELGLNGCLLTEKIKIPDNDSDEIHHAKGLLFVYFMGKEVKLSWQEIFYIQIIAGQISSVIETDSLLYEHDQKKLIDDQLKMAKEIQDNLLPAGVPYIKNIKITKINIPAAEVGGDYYDFFDLRDGKIRIVIADASGKNVPAAIVMTVFKTTLSTMDLSNLTAAEVLTKANNIIEKNITSDRFITAMYVVMDYRNGEVELSSAGHNPAFLVSKDGETKSQNVSGIPLGIMNNYTYSSIKFKMNDGDILWMYTDGVTEARNLDGKEFGETNLKTFISNYSGSNASEDLLKNLNKFVSNAHQHDDITAVTLQYKPS